MPLVTQKVARNRGDGTMNKVKSETGKRSTATASSTANGLKDHQIQALTNQIASALRPLIKHQCLRELIVRPMTAYLEDNGLRIDKP